MVLEKLFNYFVQLNLVITCIVMFILVLRFILKRHLSVHLQYVLWGILLFKLCIPIEMNSILSMFNYVPSFQQNSQEPKNIVYNMPATTETISTVADSVNSPHHVDFIIPLFTVTWIVGVILLFLLFLATYFHTYKKL
ncbi:MAG: M56 family metallopeptidase, partial [Bacillaceae bacterium]